MPLWGPKPLSLGGRLGRSDWPTAPFWCFTVVLKLEFSRTHGVTENTNANALQTLDLWAEQLRQLVTKRKGVGRNSRCWQGEFHSLPALSIVACWEYALWMSALSRNTLIANQPLSSCLFLFKFHTEITAEDYKQKRFCLSDVR